MKKTKVSNGKKKVPKSKRIMDTGLISEYNGDVPIPLQLFNNLGKVYRYKRRASSTSVTQVAGADFVGSLQFTLSSVANSTELTSLYDAYRIAYVQVCFRPLYNMQQLTTSALITPRLYTVIDLDDNTAPASISAMEEYGTCAITNFDESCCRQLTPKPALALYSGAFTSFGMAPDDTWIDCASATVQHYSVKYGVEAGAVGQTALAAWNITFTYFLEFKYVR